MRNATADEGPWVVLDSNVLVSAFAFPGGAPYQVLQALIQGEFRAAISPFMLGEVEGTLRDKLNIPERPIEEALVLLHELCTLIDPPRGELSPDLSPADNQVLDCAVAADVRYLVTGDKGILRLQTYGEIEIVSPAAFIGLLRARFDW